MYKPNDKSSRKNAPELTTYAPSIPLPQKMYFNIMRKVFQSRFSIRFDQGADFQKDYVIPSHTRRHNVKLLHRSNDG